MGLWYVRYLNGVVTLMVCFSHLFVGRMGLNFHHPVAEHILPLNCEYLSLSILLMLMNTCFSFQMNKVLDF